MSITPGGSRDQDNARLTPRTAGGMDHAPSFVGGNLVGHAVSGLDEALGIEPGEGSLADRDMPIGSALAQAQGRVPQWRSDLANDAGKLPAAGMPTPAGSSGDERASAARADEARSPRPGGDTLRSRTDGLD